MDFKKWCEGHEPAGEYSLLEWFKELQRIEDDFSKAIAVEDVENYLTDKGPIQQRMYAFLKTRAINFPKLNEEKVEELFASADAMTTFRNTMKLIWVLVSKRSYFVGPFATASKGNRRSDSERYDDIKEAMEEEIYVEDPMTKKRVSLKESVEEFAKSVFTIGNYAMLPLYPTEMKEKIVRGTPSLNQAKGWNRMQKEWFANAEFKENLPKYTNDQFAAFLLYFENDNAYCDWKKIAIMPNEAEKAYREAGRIYCEMMSSDLSGAKNRSTRIGKVALYLHYVNEAIKIRGNEIAKEALGK